MGYVGWIDTFEGEKGSGKERRFESQIVRDLRSLGAIPFAKVSIVNITIARGDSN
jgi:amidase